MVESDSLTQYLYRVSLEPNSWPITFHSPFEPNAASLGALDGFVRGFNAAMGSKGASAWEPFFLWLRDEAGIFTGRGWAPECLERASGDHLRAIEVFFGFLHEYLLLRRPAWFLRLNSAPCPSMCVRGTGTPVSPDVRKRDHVLAATGEEPVAGPDIRLSAFELGDGYHLRIGLPSSVATWWNGRGSRAVYLGSDLPEDLQAKATRALAGRREALLEFVDAVTQQVRAAGAHTVEGCVVDGFVDRCEVIAFGGAVAALVRGGILSEMASTRGEPALQTWAVQPRDHVMVCSSAVARHVEGVGAGQLPANLATCEPLAWAQCVSTPARRLALDLFWAPAAS